MIIRSIRLQPFAGTADRTFNFNAGLNVVLGPNESGKSTLVNALKAVLFTDVNLTTVKFKSQMGSYLPIGGGDTIHVAAEILFNEETYRLEKHWGATKSARLSLDGGEFYTSAEEITRKMNLLLGLNRGTYENILIIRQASLSETIKTIEEEAEASESIQQILRNSRFKMDGVSVPRLRKLTEDRVYEYFSRWDRNAGKPEGMRDYGNEWKKDVGKILDAYYKFRKAEDHYNRAVKFEEQLDQIVTKIKNVSEELACLEKYVVLYKPAYDDASKRSNLELQRTIISGSIRELVEVQKAWPRIDVELEYLRKNRDELQTSLSQLEEEERNAEKYESQKIVREKYARAKRIFDEYISEKEKVNNLQRVTRQDLEELEANSKTLEQLKIKFEAQKLKLKISADRELKVSLTEGLGSPKEIQLKENGEYENTASGSVCIKAGDLTISVQSGNADVQKLISQLETSRRNYESLLLKFSVANEAELKLKADIYKERFDTAKVMADNLKRELGDQTYMDLETRFNALEEISAQRPAAVIMKEIADVRDKFTAVKMKIQEKESQIKLWQQKYQSEDELSRQHAAKKIEEMKIDEEIAKLRAFPKEYDTMEAFVCEFERKNARYSAAREELSDLRVEKANCEKDEPGASAEELRYEVIEARGIFERVKKEGESYLLINEELNRLLAELDRDTFEPLKKEVSSLLQKLTIDKYSSLSMNEVVPEGIRLNGSTIPVELLSAGTKDILALAVRLGMANFYLNGRQGFVVMDDPLVNLDPRRQRVAVECIRQVAEKKQVIVLTCHPSHAELFGTGIISLG